MHLFLVELEWHDNVVVKTIVLASTNKEAVSVFTDRFYTSMKVTPLCAKEEAIDATTQSPLFSEEC